MIFGLASKSKVVVIMHCLLYLKQSNTLENGAAVCNPETLDLKNAFDRVNHFKLFTSLGSANVPAWVITLLVKW
jgi:hypothetical protein